MTATAPPGPRPASGVGAITSDKQDGVLVVTIDQPGDAVNKVDRALGAELERFRTR